MKKLLVLGALSLFCCGAESFGVMYPYFVGDDEYAERCFLLNELKDDELKDMDVTDVELGNSAPGEAKTVLEALCDKKHLVRLSLIQCNFSSDGDVNALIKLLETSASLESINILHTYMTNECYSKLIEALLKNDNLIGADLYPIVDVEKSILEGWDKQVQEKCASNRERIAKTNLSQN